MAENERLDLGSSARMRVVLDAFRNGQFCDEVAAKLRKYLIGGLRKALIELREMGVTLADLLGSRNSPQVLRQLLRKVQGHDYARLFAEVAATAGPTDTDCVTGWIEGILDRVTDQIGLRVAESSHCQTMENFLAFASEVRDRLRPDVERLVTKLVEDPNRLPRQAPTRGQVPVDATADLMDFSLLGAPSL
jgi:hypothetical protein